MWFAYFMNTLFTLGGIPSTQNTVLFSSGCLTEKEISFILVESRRVEKIKIHII